LFCYEAVFTQIAGPLGYETPQFSADVAAHGKCLRACAFANRIRCSNCK
jgi:hypothetical protein